MANYRVAKRYAKGLLDFSNQTQQTQEVYNEMKDLNNLLSNSKELKNFFKSPILDFRKKQEIAKELFKKYSQTTQKFIHLVIGRGRENNLQEIAKQYIQITDEKNGIQKVELTTAQPINQEKLNQILKNNHLIKNPKEINLHTKVDPNLIGGYILKVKDKQIDASIKSKLNKIRTNFDENQYIPKY